MLDDYNPPVRGIGYWEQRTSWRGYPYRVWRPSMPRMPQTLIETVFYIYPTKQDAVQGSEFGASGFFFQERSKVLPNKAHTYAVTNAHVVFQEVMENPILRINTTDEKFDLIQTSIKNWRRHPNGDDIAICPIQLNIQKYEYISVKREDMVDDQFIKEFNVGPGDDVVMIGRFRVHAGTERNLPTHSFGCIAAMNDEPIYNPFTQLKQESFIVEMRSISGFSGSPVVIYITPMSFRFKQGFGKTEPLEMVYRQRLLGIQWGHITYKTKAKDQTGQEIKVEMDSAMAGVVPAWKIIELIDDKEMSEMRQEIDEEIKMKIEGPAPVGRTHKVLGG